MNNKWNRFIYKLGSPIYDLFFNRGIFYAARKKVFNQFPIEEGQKVLFVGIGTGADLSFFPIEQLQITAIDYSEEMLQKAKEKYPNSKIEFIHMDAESLELKDDSFDVVVASLVLSVVPHPKKVMSEVLRVTNNGGRVIIFDKFARGKLSFGKRIIRPFVKIMGTDIGISFEEVYETVKHNCHVLTDEDVMLSGMYRKILLEKSDGYCYDIKSRCIKKPVY